MHPTPKQPAVLDSSNARTLSLTSEGRTLHVYERVSFISGGRGSEDTARVKKAVATHIKRVIILGTPRPAHRIQKSNAHDDDPTYTKVRVVIHASEKIPGNAVREVTNVISSSEKGTGAPRLHQSWGYPAARLLVFRNSEFLRHSY